MCGDVYEKRREVVQSSRRICKKGAKFAVLLTRASSRAGNLGSHGHLGLSIVVPRTTSDVENAVGFLGCTSSPHAGEVKAEAWVGLKAPDTNFRQLIIARNVRNLEHQISGGRLVGRSCARDNLDALRPGEVAVRTVYVIRGDVLGVGVRCQVKARKIVELCWWSARHQA